MPFPTADIALDLGIVLFFLLRNNIDACGRGVRATTLSPSSAALGTLLVVLVLFVSLALMGRLLTRHVKKGKISGLSLFRVFLFFLSSLFSWGHLESILQVLEDDYSNVFAFALTAFSTTSSQESRSQSRVSNWAQLKGLRPFRKYRIIVSLFGVVAGSNSWKTACRCSKWAIQSRIFSSWY